MLDADIPDLIDQFLSSQVITFREDSPLRCDVRTCLQDLLEKTSMMMTMTMIHLQGQHVTIADFPKIGSQIPCQETRQTSR